MRFLAYNVIMVLKLDCIFNNKEPLKADIIRLLEDNTLNEELFVLADKVRAENVGDEVHLRGLIEFSNICKCTCKYCGLRAENSSLERFRLRPDEILECAKNASKAGFKTVVLQSGEDPYYTKELMTEIIREIKKLDLALTLSIGERSFEDLKAFREAGADRYLIRIETTDRALYGALHPGMSFENRVRCLKDLGKLGYEVGSGSLVGLPGQSLESLANDILFFREIGLDMVGLGPFIPHPMTPLKAASNGDFTLALKVMAITRILLKDVNIPATTAMETICPNGRLKALKSGANVVMPNVSGEVCKKNYDIYPGKSGLNGNSDEISEFKNALKSIGGSVSSGYGFRKSFKVE